MIGNTSVAPKPIFEIQLHPRLQTEESAAAAWIAYAGAKVLWRSGEYHDQHPEEERSDLPFDEEIHAQTTLAKYWAEYRSTNPDQANRYLDALVELQGAGFVAEYIDEHIAPAEWVRSRPLRSAEFAQWQTDSDQGVVTPELLSRVDTRIRALRKDLPRFGVTGALVNATPLLLGLVLYFLFQPSLVGTLTLLLGGSVSLFLGFSSLPMLEWVEATDSQVLGKRFWTRRAVAAPLDTLKEFRVDFYTEGETMLIRSATFTFRGGLVVFLFESDWHNFQLFIAKALVDPASRLPCPPALGSLALVGVDVFDDPRLGRCYRYQGPEVAFSLYLYNKGFDRIAPEENSELMADELNFARAALLELNGEDLTGLETIREATTHCPPLALNTLSLRFSLGGVRRESHIFLTAFRDHFLKIRVTGDAATATQWRPKVDAALMELGMVCTRTEL